jgi:hypothetical protein
MQMSEFKPVGSEKISIHHMVEFVEKIGLFRDSFSTETTQLGEFEEEGILGGSVISQRAEFPLHDKLIGISITTTIWDLDSEPDPNGVYNEEIYSLSVIERFVSTGGVQQEINNTYSVVKNLFTGELDAELSNERYIINDPRDPNAKFTLIRAEELAHNEAVKKGEDSEKGTAGVWLEALRRTLELEKAIGEDNFNNHHFIEVMGILESLLDIRNLQ